MSESAAGGNARTWVAFGSTGALGSIHDADGGYSIKLLNDEEYRGSYPSLDIAKSALHSALLPGTEWPEFREH